MRLLNTLLRMDPSVMTENDKAILTDLAGGVGTDLSEALRVYPKKEVDEAPIGEAHGRTMSELAMDQTGGQQAAFSCSRRSRLRAAMQSDAQTQCDMDYEMIVSKTMWTTPNRCCVHTSKSCYSLRGSTRFIQPDVCQMCVPTLKESGRASRSG